MMTNVIDADQKKQIRRQWQLAKHRRLYAPNIRANIPSNRKGTPLPLIIRQSLLTHRRAGIFSFIAGRKLHQ
ncbi:MAG: hypothetical protein GXP11_02855 [Gammaproteobacteria bacterium]|nr:hypothetical protein [Gammaproteobacteria bacterium]